MNHGEMNDGEMGVKTDVSRGEAWLFTGVLWFLIGALFQLTPVVFIALAQMAFGSWLRYSDLREAQRARVATEARERARKFQEGVTDQ